MSTEGINLLPVSIARRVSVGRASRIVYAAAGTLGLMAAAIAATGRWIDSRSAAQLAVARDSSAPVIALEEEIAALAAERAEIERGIETQREIGVAIPASGVVRAVAAALPAGATLERIALDYANVQGTNKRIRREARETAQSRELRGDISGVAANESDVGRIVDALSALAPISQVSLESSRSREFNGRNAREFRINFKVDLDRRWKLPEVASAVQNKEAER
jgi:threonine dehydrogenase-like Zn-dependent dehydrogenase